MRYILGFLAFSLLIFESCAVKKIASENNFETEINQSVLSKHFLGISLVRLDDNEQIIAHNAHKLFIPASNTKLLTYYASIKTLDDSIVAFKYAYSPKNDSLIIWPQGDATFLNHKFKSQKAFHFLKECNKKIYVVNGLYQGEKYGYGWAWDDYNEAYQAQISEMPIYGNQLQIASENNHLKLKPDLLSMYLSDTNSLKDMIKAKREFHSNNITYPLNFPNNFSQVIPLNMDNKTLCILLSDTLLATERFTKEVKPIGNRSLYLNAKSIYNEARDTVLKIMLQDSDNFLAEQLLLNMAFKNNIVSKQQQIIQFIKHKFLTDLPDTLQWVDGSGLSRQNLNSPKNFTHLLKLLYNEAGEENVFKLLSTGGINGTLKNQFKAEIPFVFAKSGTVSNNYCLSGFLIGNSGKRYAFSIMNNNFSLPVKQVRQEVESLITTWKEKL